MSDKAPSTLTLIVCPKCGRTDRFVSLRLGAKHYALGKLCAGTPAPVVYRKAATA